MLGPAMLACAAAFALEQDAATSSFLFDMSDDAIVGLDISNEISIVCGRNPALRPLRCYDVDVGFCGICNDTLYAQ